MARLCSLLDRLIAPSRAEPGCRYYQPFTDFADPDKVTVIEAWETPEQWHAHLRTPHVQQVLAALEGERILSRPYKTQQLLPLAAFGTSGAGA